MSTFSILSHQTRNKIYLRNLLQLGFHKIMIRQKSNALYTSFNMQAQQSDTFVSHNFLKIRNGFNFRSQPYKELMP